MGTSRQLGTLLPSSATKNLTIQDKIIVGEMALRGLPIETIRFYLVILNHLRENKRDGITMLIASQLASMTQQGCRRHIKLLTSEKYLTRKGEKRAKWVLNSDALIQDHDLRFLATLVYQPTLPKRKEALRRAS